MIAQDNIDGNTPMGATLTANGATFKVWAPGAQGVYLNGTLAGAQHWTQDQDATLLLGKDNSGYWTGFSQGPKRATTTSITSLGWEATKDISATLMQGS